MENKISRRKFLKLMGLTGLVAASEQGCSYLGLVVNRKYAEEVKNKIEEIDLLGLDKEEKEFLEFFKEKKYGLTYFYSEKNFRKLGLTRILNLDSPSNKEIIYFHRENKMLRKHFQKN